MRSSHATMSRALRNDRRVWPVGMSCSRATSMTIFADELRPSVTGVPPVRIRPLSILFLVTGERIEQCPSVEAARSVDRVRLRRFRARREVVERGASANLLRVASRRGLAAAASVFGGHARFSLADALRAQLAVARNSPDGRRPRRAALLYGQSSQRHLRDRTRPIDPPERRSRRRACRGRRADDSRSARGSAATPFRIRAVDLSRSLSRSTQGRSGRPSRIRHKRNRDPGQARLHGTAARNSANRSRRECYFQRPDTQFPTSTRHDVVNISRAAPLTVCNPTRTTTNAVFDQLG
jgi:hypothetical protein